MHIIRQYQKLLYENYQKHVFTGFIHTMKLIMEIYGWTSSLSQCLRQTEGFQVKIWIHNVSIRKIQFIVKE